MTALFRPTQRNDYTEAEIQRLIRAAEKPLPQDYLDFLREFGGVSFADAGVTFDVTWQRVDGQPMAADEDDDFEDDFMILILSSPQMVLETRSWLHGDDNPHLPPIIPKTLFPISRDADRGILLISLAEGTYGHVYIYFPGYDLWGTGNNNYLGYIASSFTDFIQNKIRLYE